eukprot:3280586-Rhodomonas_salina.1
MVHATAGFKVPVGDICLLCLSAMRIFYDYCASYRRLCRLQVLQAEIDRKKLELQSQNMLYQECCYLRLISCYYLPLRRNEAQANTFPELVLHTSSETGIAIASKNSVD